MLWALPTEADLARRWLDEIELSSGAPPSPAMSKSKKPRNRAISSSCSTYEKLPPTPTTTFTALTLAPPSPPCCKDGAAPPGLPR